jgi:alkylhydroperoxidase/carboxymuconolactone decarboxylase family protein YurZ
LIYTAIIFKSILFGRRVFEMKVGSTDENERMAALVSKLEGQLVGSQINFKALDASVLCDGALHHKIKALMMLAVAVARGENEYLGYYIQKAVQAGTCRAEILETLGVAILSGGNSSRLTSALALEAFENTGVEPECKEERLYGP